MNKGHEARMHRWRHNGLFGSVRMMQTNLQNIEGSASTSPDAKDLARKMFNDSVRLMDMLKVRIELDGTARRMYESPPPS